MKEEYRNITDKIPAKVEKLYGAVIHLLEDGKNVSSLTVAEITEKAGIGKGTAYEYFKSKEEMIARAILYGIIQSFEEIEHRIGSLTSFQAKYMEIPIMIKAMDLLTLRLVLSFTAVIIKVIMATAYRTMTTNCTYISYPGVMVLILPW